MVRNQPVTKTLRLLKDLDGYNEAEDKSVFGASGTPHVFPNKCEEGIEAHVQE